MRPAPSTAAPRATRRPRSAAPFALLVLAGCAKTGAIDPDKVDPWLVDVDFRIEVDTRLRAADSSASLPADRPAAQAMAGMARSGLDAELVLELTPTRRFRDTSRGWLVRFVEARGTVLRPDAAGTLQPAGPADGWTLEGRSVELRTFDDGEILTVGEALHIVGPDRLGSSLDVLFHALSPLPPALDEGEEARRQAGWPLTLGRGRGWRHTFVGSWRNLGLAARGEDQPGLWQLAYDGPTRTRGRDPQQAPPLGVEGDGRLEGEVWLVDVDTDALVERVQRHRWSWQRELETEFPSAPGGPVRVVQTQRISGELQRRGP